MLGPVCAGARARFAVVADQPGRRTSDRHGFEVLLGADLPLRVGLVTVSPGVWASASARPTPTRRGRRAPRRPEVPTPTCTSPCRTRSASAPRSRPRCRWTSRRRPTSRRPLRPHCPTSRASSAASAPAFGSRRYEAPGRGQAGPPSPPRRRCWRRCPTRRCWRRAGPAISPRSTRSSSAFTWRSIASWRDCRRPTICRATMSCRRRSWRSGGAPAVPRHVRREDLDPGHRREPRARSAARRQSPARPPRLLRRAPGRFVAAARRTGGAARAAGAHRRRPGRAPPRSAGRLRAVRSRGGPRASTSRAPWACPRGRSGGGSMSPARPCAPRSNGARNDQGEARAHALRRGRVSGRARARSRAAGRGRSRA